MLVYGPMSVAGYLIGVVGFGTAPLGLGFALVGTLPTDVSSPLLVWLGRGNVALATVFNAVNTALAPVVVPLLFLSYTGVDLDVPVAALTLELAVTVLVPTIVGVAVRTAVPHRVEPVEPVQSAGASPSSLALLLAVVGPNAPAMRDAPGRWPLWPVWRWLSTSPAICWRWPRGGSHPTVPHTAMLFTVSKKEFSIGAFVVFAPGLPAAVALPAVSTPSSR